MPRIHERKHSASHLGRRILGEVWHHPNNRGRRGRAVLRSLVWQGRKRVLATPRVRRVYGDMRIWMDPQHGSTSNLVYFGDHFDVDEMDFLRRYLRPGDTFVDVGANVGTYTLLAASLVGRDGRVHAFAPAPALVEGLRRNVELNDLEGTVQVHDLAVTDHSGELRFRADRDVSSRIAVDDDPDERVTVIPCAPLDDVLDGEQLGLAKIDVEGAEAAALRGFLTHLRDGNPPVLLLEVLPNQLPRQGSSVEQVAALLHDAGYDLADYSADRGSLRPVSGDEVRGNVFAVARGERDLVERRLSQRPTAA